MNNLAIYNINKIVISELKKDYYKHPENIDTIFSQKIYKIENGMFLIYEKAISWKNGIFTFKNSKQKNYKI